MDHDEKLYIMDWCVNHLRQMSESAVRMHDLVVSERDSYLAPFAGRKARDILADSPLVLTIATTGLQFSSDQIVEIVLTDRDRSVVYRQAIRPETYIRPKAHRYHGHTEESLRGAPTFAEVVGDYAAVVGGRRLIAWTGSFERDFILGECKRKKLDAAVVPVPRFYGGYAEIELDSIQQLVSEVTRIPYQPHGSTDRTPTGVGRAVWDHVEKLAGEKREDPETAFAAFLRRKQEASSPRSAPGSANANTEVPPH